MFEWMIPLLNADGGAAGGEAGGEASAGVEGAPAAGEQVEGSANQTGVEGQAAAEPEKQNNFEKAFAKRLAAEREKWEAERKAELEKVQQQLREQYKDFDAYKRAAEYLQRTSGINDLMTLQEEIELAELQERAKKENVPAEVLRRIDQLEAKAKRAEELEAQQRQLAEQQAFEQSLREFCEGKEIDGKPVDYKELWQYMYENQIGKPEAALKAMKSEILEQKLATAKKEAIEEYLKSKQAPRAEGASGSLAPAQPGPAPVPSSWEETEQRALARIRAAREQA